MIRPTLLAYAEGIEHLSALNVGDVIDDLGIHYDRGKRDQVRYEFLRSKTSKQNFFFK